MNLMVLALLPNLTQSLLPVALLGAEWVLYLLLVLSIISIAIMIERIWYFRSTDIDIESLLADLKVMLSHGDVKKAMARIKSSPQLIESVEGQVAQAGIGEFERGASATEKAMGSTKSRAKLLLERNLAYLGTVGNNAPFIGLFGTVIGVIKAFHDLASKKGQGPEAVMGSISEALIATGVGLLVAIPAVVAFNYFNRRVRGRLANTDALAQLILSQVGADSEGAAESARGAK